ncbi:GuaB3 family IMP dehydrogenase-related protein [Micromonospora sp. NPDC007208]|uniref:GuaB3 family IMP dehydrogenase-related protein n=2 Tax=Micromonospora TaxID=1873 RepID=A0A3N9XIL1_9ACTN|nr:MULTISPECIES: GuaB3 family IMP dehydrogenase-related protein [Micromonospora]MBQ1019482.1 GuaB3 family IMP dehydrogenase-related protein [Micromonospora sp. D93]MCG5435351.1 GuaB3 family IMP dehydrogenase-related protein [Micromonospora foliorum]RQW94525.1 GuaB3 family IMP dehydrogenase-related protein [Micromonospora inaquosa]RQX12906.1 GuaB3 family IMP dehydrogenase-related protein [Micromonospora ureilytica]WSG32721.1 GuaB3 family IMP dehydrogenase-related protein [Micromonospora ureilyt
MRDVVEIGLGKTAQRGYHLDDIAIVPSRRTRDVDDVSTSWQLDAYPFGIPCVGHPSDATMSPSSAVRLGQLGGLGVLNVEGLWTRYENPTKVLDELAGLDEEARATKRLQEVYAEPIRPDLIAERVRELRAGGGTVAVRVSPQHTLALAPVILDAGVDILVIQGTIVSAEHVSTTDEPLNLKEFIADLDLPVIVGGCTDYKTALHLMRTGAAGVIVGIGGDEWSTTESVLGIRVPMATAIADAAAARRDYLDETGGRYVHLIADGDIQTSGDIAKALGCGADAVMLGEPLSLCDEAPAGGAWWHSAASHPSLPRGAFEVSGEPLGSMEQLLFGPADEADGQLNLFGGLRRAMAKCGYRDLKEFQKVGLVLDR